MSTGYSRAYAQRYVHGSNETIDRLHDGQTDIWIVNGIKGRKVLLMPPGTTQDEAKAHYDDLYGTTYFGGKSE